MSRCDICGTEQKKIGESAVKICEQELKVSHYNINIMTHIHGKWICVNCMDTYHKIYAMEMGYNFSCGGKEYYADGRNLGK